MTDSPSMVDQMETARVAELVEEYHACGFTAAQARSYAAEWDHDGEPGIGDTYRRVADKLDGESAALSA